MNDKASSVLDAADAVFLLADIAGAAKVTTRAIDWPQVGAFAARIKSDIQALNIPLDSPDVSTTLCAVQFDDEVALVVDVASAGGDVPDPLRFVFVVRGREYLGGAGKVAS